MKIFSIALIAGMILFSSLCLAETTVRTEINTTGYLNMTHTTNNQTIHIETNGSTNISTSRNDSEVIFSINTTGPGTMEANISGGHEINVTADGVEEKYSGENPFSKIYNFIRDFIFMGWFRINSPGTEF